MLKALKNFFFFGYCIICSTPYGEIRVCRTRTKVGARRYIRYFRAQTGDTYFVREVDSNRVYFL